MDNLVNELFLKYFLILRASPSNPQIIYLHLRGIEVSKDIKDNYGTKGSVFRIFLKILRMDCL